MKNFKEILDTEETLDPQDWSTMRQLGHQMLDDMFTYLETTTQRPVWTPTTEGVRAAFQQPLPTEPTDAATIYDDFKRDILPFNKGNVHPRFWSWVEGGGTPLGMLADMLASGMNPNTTIGDHAAMQVDRQVIDWSKSLFGLPTTATGMLVSGGAMANISAIVVARNSFSEKIRTEGNAAAGGQLTLYASTETHNCLVKAAEVIGIGRDNLREVPVGDDFRMDVSALKKMIFDDKHAGKVPFCIVGNAGTVNTGAIDPLDELLQVARTEGLWLHIDGAFGAVAKLTDEFAAELKAIEQADSLAFDFHKWFYVNYEVGCFLIRNGDLHRKAFALTATYLAAHERGLAAGLDPMANYGLELSRGFKALKVWMSLREHGAEKYARLVRQNVAQAFYLGDLVENARELELLSPVTMNIVCFRFKPADLSDDDILNALNKEILMRLQEQGIAAPSYTMLTGRYAIRCAICNHRSRKSDFEALVAGVLTIGRAVLEENLVEL